MEDNNSTTSNTSNSLNTNSSASADTNQGVSTNNTGSGTTFAPSPSSGYTLGANISFNGSGSTPTPSPSSGYTLGANISLNGSGSTPTPSPSSGYTLGANISLNGSGSTPTPSPSSGFTLSANIKSLSPPFTLRTGEKSPGDTTPARPNDSKEAPRNKPENQASTLKPSGINNKQQSSSKPSEILSSIKEWWRDVSTSEKDKNTEKAISTKQANISTKHINITSTQEKTLLTNPSISSDEKARADKIKRIAIQSAKNNRDNCSGSTAESVNNLGNSELNGKNAKKQLDHMEKYWREVAREEAKDLADRGNIVVAGRKEEGKPSHTTIVVTGPGKEDGGKVYPNIAGGAKDSAHPGAAGYAYSEGQKTVRDAWGNKQNRKYDTVKYYTPK
jgi:hypothetical protein